MGKTLVAILQSHLDLVLPLAGVNVQLATTKLFKQLESTTNPTITVFLYRVMENPELRNAPRRRLSDGSMTRPLLPLELCYLVTPWGVRANDTPLADQLAAQEEHRLLGIALQAFYDHAEIGRSELVEGPGEPVWEATDNVQLILDTLPVEDHYRIWDSGELDYRVSLTYRVRVLGLEPSRHTVVPPVVDAGFAWQPGTGTGAT
ncbi:DUF4255 domain-containing protein [Sorangium sp. So ce394]|uniref:DUF4255 domain-containing protein n=1 Tax=Sorangium sp. So ce394 TaxID=3133310 RepID=UPI003F5AF949